MSQDAENKQCQICHGYLFDDDDTVVCPVCGAPHHRDCWQSVGHCGVQDDHGTENEYSKRIMREKAEAKQTSGNESVERHFCPYCGRESHSEDSKFCPYCGRPFNGSQRQNQAFGHEPEMFKGVPFEINSCGNVPKDTVIEDCKAGDLAKFVGSNSHRYIPKFATLTKQNKSSWNWTAFFFPSVWCFARKMYLNGALFFILSLASNLCFLSFNSTFNELFDTEGLTQREVYQLVYSNIGELSWIVILLMVVGLLLSIIPRIIAGRNADWMYRGFALDKVKRITTDPEVENVDEELMHQGNVNIFLMFIVLLAEQYLPSIIGSFIV